MKKKQRLAIDDALNSALKPPARKPSDNLNSLLSQYAPASDALEETSASGAASPEVNALKHIAPAHSATPASSAAAAQNDFEPLHRAAVAQHSTPAQQTAVAGFTRIPHEVLDRILPTLDTYDQSLLIRLYRLTRGFNKDTCRVSVPTLAKACNISERQIRKSIIKLEGRGFIQRVGQDFGNKDLALRGMFIPLCK
ncbi:MAG: replication protein [Acidobacteria bacterium]|nr:replication protein [Acidobacteriota bacterium]